jgi:hypothetical protein
MISDWFSRYLSVLVIAGAIAIVTAVSFLIWGTTQAPAFYGAVTAAIVAASAVIAGAHYQAALVRRRDDELRK